MALLDLISSDGDLRKEQDVLDEHEELFDNLNMRANQLLLFCTASKEPELHTVAYKCLTHLKKSIDTAGVEITKLDTAVTTDNCLVRTPA